MKEKINSKLALAIIALTAVIIGFAVWTSYSAEKNGHDSVEVLSQATSDSGYSFLDDDRLYEKGFTEDGEVIPTGAGEDREKKKPEFKKVDEILAWLPAYQKSIEKSYDVTVADGNILVSSIVSPDKTKIVYAEISECFAFVKDTVWGISYSSDHVDPCDTRFEYIVSVMDLETNAVDKIYEQSQENTSQKFSFIDLIVPSVIAGGVSTVGDFPIGWSRDSAWIFVKKGVLLGAATGAGSDDYDIGRINVDTKKYEPLSKGSTIFSSDYRYMIYAKHDQTRPQGCMYGAPSNPNYLNLVMRDFSNNSETVLFSSEVDSIEIVAPSISKNKIDMYLVPSKMTENECIGSDDDRIEEWENRHIVKKIDVPEGVSLIDQENDLQVIKRWRSAHSSE